MSAWSRDGKTIATITNKNVVLYSFKETSGNISLTEVKRIKADVAEIVERRLGNEVEDVGFSPDGRYIAISGTYAISAGPSIAHVSGLGFVIVIDTESGEVVFVDSGGTLLQDNLAHFDWAPDGTLVYLFDGESILNLHGYKPA
jgi:hypothetical protein